MIKKISILVLLISLLSISTLYASPVIEENTSGVAVTENQTEEIAEKTISFPRNVDIKEKEILNETDVVGSSNNEDSDSQESDSKKVFVFLNKDTGEEILVEGSADYELFITQLKRSVTSDAKLGLSNLRELKTTVDYIRLDTWGEFFNNYYGKSLTNFKSGPIKIKFDSYEFYIANSEISRRYIKEKLLPEMIKSIEVEAQNYPVKRYALDITSGTFLKDYECDLNSVREIKTVYPLDDIEEYVFYNTGAFYGLTMSTEYVQIMKGYLEGDTIGYDRPVDGEYPGCVNVLSYITLLRNVEGYKLDDKVLSDFMIYNNLAIALDTKKLVDTSDMTTNGREILFSDFKLDPDKLVLVPISNDVVIIQPTYLACVYYNNLNRGLYRTIDTMRFITTGANTFDLIDKAGNVTEVPIEYFIDNNNGYLGTQLGGAPFLMYYSNHVPYDLLIDWVYNYAPSEGFDQSIIDSTKNLIKKEMKEQKLTKEYNEYLKAAGQTTETTKSIIGIVVGVIFVLGVVVGVIIIRKKMKASDALTASEASNNLLFDDYDSDDEDDDDGGFELR